MKIRNGLYSAGIAASLLAGFAGGALTGADHPVTAAIIECAERILGLEFTPAERDQMAGILNSNRRKYETLRSLDLPNSVPPALLFDPTAAAPGEGNGFSLIGDSLQVHPPDTVARPADLEDLAFESVRNLAGLIRTRQVTSVELTQMYLERLKRYDPALHCVVTLTEDLAMEQARRADREIAAGQYRGLLHGIPYGAKDLLAVEGYKTTWGAEAYKDQIIDDTATVVRKLEEAGAVLTAKLTLGALAMGDVWFGGKTRSPWNPGLGSSGSSAGSAAAVSAGLVGFAIGSETWGSIGSPSARCGIAGHRPTFGRVSRAGAMALSWSMDKIGPMGRTAEDCAIVFAAIHGADGLDPTAVSRPFRYSPDVAWSQLKVGFLEAALAEGEGEEGGDSNGNRGEDKAAYGAAMDTLRGFGAQLVPMQPPDYPANAISFVLNTEAAAAFDDLTRSNRDDLLVAQENGSWPNVFRAHRFVPAVEYIQANRARYRLMREMNALMKTVDFYIAPLRDDSGNSLITNLTGHPAVFVPNGFGADGMPLSLCFVGQLYGDDTLLAAADAYQRATGHHLRHPDMDAEAFSNPE